MTKWVRKWARKSRIPFAHLVSAIEIIEDGLSTSELGSSLFKVRIPGKNRGKSSGFRLLIVFKINERAIIVYGFSKSEKDNLDRKELEMFKKLSGDLLAMTNEEVEEAKRQGIFFEL